MKISVTVYWCWHIHQCGLILNGLLSQSHEFWQLLSLLQWQRTLDTTRLHIYRNSVFQWIKSECERMHLRLWDHASLRCASTQCRYTTNLWKCTSSQGSWELVKQYKSTKDFKIVLHMLEYILPHVETDNVGDGIPTTPDWCTAATRNSYSVSCLSPVTAAIFDLVCCNASQSVSIRRR